MVLDLGFSVWGLVLGFGFRAYRAQDLWVERSGCVWVLGLKGFEG